MQFPAWPHRCVRVPKRGLEPRSNKTSIPLRLFTDFSSAESPATFTGRWGRITIMKKNTYQAYNLISLFAVFKMPAKTPRMPFFLKR